MGRWLMLAGGLLIAAGLGLGLWRVVDLEVSELEYTSPWQRLTPTLDEKSRRFLPHRELGRAELHAGEDVTVEVCARDQLQVEPWSKAGVQLALWRPEVQKVAVQLDLDRAALTRVSRGAEIACLVIAEGGGLQEGGEYAVEAIWAGGELSPELAQVPFQVRVHAFMPDQSHDRWLVAIVLFGALLLTVAMALRRPVEGSLEPPRPSTALLPSRPLTRVAVAVSTLVAAGTLLSMLPLGGAVGGLSRALLLALVQLLIVLVLLRSDRSVAASERWAIVGLRAPRQGVWVLALAPIFGLGLWLLGQLPLRFVPSTGQSAVGAMVSWPSGSLAVALASVLTPVVEEIFFRGFIYGALARRTRTSLAFLMTVFVFTAVHLPQTWGAWGGLVAITLTGIGLTALRAWTGSIVVPALAHLAHNGAIILLSVLLSQG